MGPGPGVAGELLIDRTAQLARESDAEILGLQTGVAWGSFPSPAVAARERAPTPPRALGG